MLHGVRVRLTVTYAVAALFVTVLMGFGSYVLLEHYFESNTDEALKFRMAEEFQTTFGSLPAELARAKSAWEADHEDEADNEAGRGPRFVPPGLARKLPSSELAPLYTVRLDPQGRPLLATGQDVPPLSADAVDRARARGNDVRTITDSEGSHVRIVTYAAATTAAEGDGATDAASEVAFIQVGRWLADQDRILSQLLTGVLALCAASALLVGGVSWWFSGRAIRPAKIAWEKQRELVANAGHELRTPITLVRATAEVARRELHGGADLKKTDDLLVEILNETDHLTKLTDDLVLLSRLDSGHIVFSKVPIDLSAFLQDIAVGFGRLSDERGVRLAVGPTEGIIAADPVRVRQAIAIALDNAMRFTPSGGEICLQTEASGGWVEISVRDTGAGIADAELERVFERFYQGPSSADDDESRHSGLGLAIARAVVEGQGGRLALTSRLGEGTTLTLSFPSVLGS
jgi:signal transduction histidine kinase